MRLNGDSSELVERNAVFKILSYYQSLMDRVSALPTITASNHAELSERVGKLELSLETLSRRAAFVMKTLEDEGQGIVPHLLDSDDNAGQYLRDAIDEARALLTDGDGR